MRIPEFKEPRLKDVLTDMEREYKDLAGDKISKSTANHSVLLQSPAGKVYEITVDDAGVLVSTLVADV